MGDWRVRGVDHLAVVNAYYAGVVRVQETSLRPPTEPFFRVYGALTDGAATDSSRARKKRKRQQHQQQQLAALVASGKFVPLGAALEEALEQARNQALREDAWKVILTKDIGDDANDTTFQPVDEPEEAHVAMVSGESYANASSAVVHIMHNQELCVMPPHSAFLMGDVRVTLPVETRRRGAFQFVLMDPPWENKSVDRKRCYSTFHHRELLKLPISDLCSGGDGGDDDSSCVLAIWVTNRPTYRTFILDELLAHWGFTYHATWYWLKVCTNGELVSPLRSSHRLPVEKLVVATRATSEAAHARLRVRLGTTPQVVVSVPLRHSWKPPPESFFDVETLAGRNMEIFARELRPHFVSVGVEPLKFQSAVHFNQCSSGMGTV